jgi:hypothetical protein
MVYPFCVAKCSVPKEVNETSSFCTAKEKWSFSLSTFLWGCGTNCTGDLLPCLKEPNKLAFDVCEFIVSEKKC